MSPRQRQIIEDAIAQYKRRLRQETNLIFTLAGGRWRITRLFFQKGATQYSECHVELVRWTSKWLPGKGHYEVIRGKHLRRLTADSVFEAINEIVCHRVHAA